MAIETRSATKRRVLQAAREIEMGWLEWAIYKFKCTLDTLSDFVKEHSILLPILFIICLIIAVVLHEYPQISH